jgi:hypothetical protein
MGHEIGLNVVSFPAALATYSVEQYVRAESQRLSLALGGGPICCVSFTEPPAEQSGESLFIGNLVNASSPILMRWSLVDTDKTWSIPVPSPAERNPDRALLQLVVQPALWDATVLT